MSHQLSSVSLGRPGGSYHSLFYKSGETAPLAPNYLFSLRDDRVLRIGMSMVIPYPMQTK